MTTKCHKSCVHLICNSVCDPDCTDSTWLRHYDISLGFLMHSGARIAASCKFQTLESRVGTGHHGFALSLLADSLNAPFGQELKNSPPTGRCIACPKHSRIEGQETAPPCPLSNQSSKINLKPSLQHHSASSGESANPAVTDVFLMVAHTKRQVIELLKFMRLLRHHMILAKLQSAASRHGINLIPASQSTNIRVMANRT